MVEVSKAESTSKYSESEKHFNKRLLFDTLSDRSTFWGHPKEYKYRVLNIHFKFGTC